MSDQHPTCHIHGTNIVSKFPPGCPMAEQNPLLAQYDLQTTGNALMAKLTATATSDGLNVLETFRTCGACLDVNLSHKRVRALRQKLIGDVNPSEQHQRILGAIKRTPKHG